MSPPFDPSAWLTAFTEAGGSYALAGDGRLWLGEIGDGGDKWWHVCQLVGHPERLEAVKALVKERCLIA